MLNTNLFNYAEERVNAIASGKFHCWYKLVQEEQEQQQRQEYYFNKFLDDDMDRCRGGF
jgi:uncharacterized protein YdaT